MSALAQDLLARLSADRLAQLTYALCAVPSPTGDTREVAGVYRDILTALGVQTTVVTDYPQSPVVIGRWGTRTERVLTLNGHLDTVPIPHPPPRLEGERVYGRGAADMKSALAAIAEVLRVLAESGLRLGGTVQVIAHGLHEAPGGYGEDLAAVVRRGMGGTAALVAELGWDVLPVVGLGAALFAITVARAGEVTHELDTPPQTPHPLLAAGRVLTALEAYQQTLRARRVPYVGSESVFVGQVQGGDFYNRFPTECRIVGTRRWGPERSFAEVREEFDRWLTPLAETTGCAVRVDLRLIRDSYQIDPGEPLVQALRRAYREVTGRELPLGGSRLVADAPIFVRAGGIPCVYHGIRGYGAHADLEYVEVAEVLRAARVYLLTALYYLGYEES